MYIFYCENVIIAIAEKHSRKAMIEMIPLTIRYDETTHRKLKIIAAYMNESLNRFLLSSFDKIIADWEREHGKIEFPEQVKA